MAESKSIRRTFLSGAFWTSGQQIILTLLGVLQLAITSRLLSPADFGTYAIATFFSSLGSIAFAMGFSAALIQKKGDISSYLNTTWSASIGVAIAASVIIGALVPFICSSYYHNDAAIYPSLVIMLNCVLVAASNPGLIIYHKEIQLKKIFFLNVTAKLLSFILVVFFVIVLKSYWGLIIALLSESLFRLILSFKIHPYRPKFQFKWQQFKELYSFSGWIQLKNITSWLASSLDTAIVGNLLGTSKLGSYNRAQTVAAYPRLFINKVVDSVAFPLYAKVNDNHEKMQNVFNKIQDVIIALTGAMSILFIAFGHQIILLILGEKWIDMVNPFKLLFVSYSIQTLFLSFIPVLRSYGFSKQEFVIYVIQICTMVVSLYFFVSRYDLLGAGLAMLICVLVLFPGMIYYVRKKTGLSMTHYLESLSVTIIAVGIISYILSLIDLSLQSLLLWGSEAVVACLIYCLLLIIIGVIFKIGPGLPLLSLIKK